MAVARNDSSPRLSNPSSPSSWRHAQMRRGTSFAPFSPASTHPHQPRDDGPRAVPARDDPGKKSLVASERCEEGVEVQHKAFVERIQACDPERLIFLDESGSHVAMTRTHAWAPKGRRAPGIVPRNRGTVTTMIGALSIDGIEAMMTVEGARPPRSFYNSSTSISRRSRSTRPTGYPRRSCMGVRRSTIRARWRGLGRQSRTVIRPRTPARRRGRTRFPPACRWRIAHGGSLT